VALKLAVIGLFIVIGAMHIHTVNWTRDFLPFGMSGVFGGASLIFFAYIGFDQVSTAAEEARDPQRTMPRGIILSLVICTVLYILVSGVLTGMLPYTKLNNPSPVSHALLQVGLNSAATIVAVGIVAGLFTVLLALLFGQSRILFSMSRDGMLPGVFSRVHGTFRTPFISTMIVGVLIALLAGLTPIEDLVKMVNIGTLAAFVLVSLAVWRLRVTQPDLERGFRLPFVPVLPILSALASLFLIFTLPSITWLRFVVWLAVGFAIYFLYGRRHSRLEQDVAKAS
jgi:APA family basic amino acid/polyamine antiporter